MNELVLLLWSGFAFIALIWRLILLGGELIDLERLLKRDRNGLTRIESIQHVRTEAQWAYAALVLVTVGLLTLTSVWWRGEVSRWLLVSVSLLMMVAPIWDYWDRRRKIRLIIDEEQSEDTRKISALESERKSYQGMAEEAITRLEAAAAEARAERGEPPVARLADVVPEHSSPVTQAQHDTAELQTLRAHLVAAALGLRQAPRSASAPTDTGAEPQP